MVKTKAEAAKLATTPLPIACELIVAHHSRLPVVAASKIPTATMVDHEPEGVGKVIVPALLICEGVVEPPVIDDHPLDDVTATRE